MMLKDVKDYNEDKITFAKEILIYGRKSGKMLNNVEWYNGIATDVRNLLSPNRPFHH